MTSSLLTPPLNQNAPIKDLERLWLECTCAYDQLDDNIMEDSFWDRLTIELREREDEWSPYFKQAVPRDCILSSTSSGINWDEGLPAIVLQGLSTNKTDRLTRWEARLRQLNRELTCEKHNWYLGECCLCGANHIYWTGMKQ